MNHYSNIMIEHIKPIQSTIFNYCLFAYVSDERERKGKNIFEQANK
jgi:hypothetical protein